jgi:PBP1b-binding outer membrane lipoprotein LpoB
MKKVLAILLATILLAGCEKETPAEQQTVDASKNPQLISVSVNGSTSEIVRVR